MGKGGCKRRGGRVFLRASTGGFVRGLLLALVAAPLLLALGLFALLSGGGLEAAAALLVDSFAAILSMALNALGPSLVVVVGIALILKSLFK